jgi:hypothetical protein
MNPKRKKLLTRFIILFFIVNTIYLIFHLKSVSCYKTEGIPALVLNELVAWNLFEVTIPIVDGTIVLKPWTSIATGTSSGGEIYQIDNTNGRSIIDAEILGNKLNNKVSFSLSGGRIYEIVSEKEPQKITFEGTDFSVSIISFEYDQEKKAFFLAQLIASNFSEIKLKDNTIIHPGNGSERFYFSTKWTTEMKKEEGSDFYETWCISILTNKSILKIFNPNWPEERNTDGVEFWPEWGGVTVYYKEDEEGNIEGQYDLFNLESEK